MDYRSRLTSLATVLLVLAAVGFVTFQVYHLFSLRSLMNGVRQGRESACARVLRMGDNAVGPLMGLLDDRSPTARVYAALLLGDIGSPTALPGLMRAVHDTHPTVRSQAALALGHLGDAAAVPALIRCLGDEPVRMAAASSLGRLGDPRAVPALIPLLSSDSEHVRNRTAWALAAIGGDDATAALVAALERSDLAAVAGAHRFFIAQGIQGSEKVLIQALESDQSTPWMAACYLSSGNELLATAARAWAAERLDRTRVLESFTRDTPKWGAGTYSSDAE